MFTKLMPSIKKKAYKRIESGIMNTTIIEQRERCKARVVPSSSQIEGKPLLWSSGMPIIFEYL